MSVIQEYGNRVLYILHWGLIAFLIAARLVFAQTNSAEAIISREEARVLVDRASQLKSQAVQQFERDKTECYKKILMSRCIATADKQKQKLISDANAMATQGRDAERELKKRERESKDSQQAADATRIKSEAQERTEKHRQEQAMRDADREKKRKQDEFDASKRREKIQVDELARQKKSAERTRADAEHEKQKPALLKAWQDRQKEIADHSAQIEARLKSKEEDRKRKEAGKAAKRTAEEVAKSNAAKTSLLCQLLPSQLCKTD